jgi:predicted Zn-dependent protease
MNRFHDAGKFLLSACSLIALEACSVNPATGQQQFTALMPASQEASVGATEHQKALAQYGVYGDTRVQNYVKNIGQKLVPVTERKDVTYTFTVLDSPDINAFALPGGYVYVTRGLMAWANSEAELAAVMGHEIGHVNARHSAARYSQGVAAQLGLSVLSAVTNTPWINQAAGVGSDLLQAQYSQGQEYEADTLGIRYTQKTGYDPLAMSRFLQQLNRETAYRGQTGSGGLNDFFASHPNTPARVQRSAQEASGLPAGQDDVVAYMQAINGLTYGDNGKEGMIEGASFIHPQMGFRFDAPNGTKLTNASNAVTGTRADGLAMIFDMAQKDTTTPIAQYVSNIWMKGNAGNVETLQIAGLPAATAQAQGSINGQTMAVRIVAIQATPTQVYRFQYAVPASAASNMTVQNEMQASARSFRLLSEAERKVSNRRVEVIAAASGDTVDTFARKMGGFTAQEARALFMAINGMDNAQPLQAGRLYKIIR